MDKEKAPRIQSFPPFVRKICSLVNAWIVGSSALPGERKTHRDIDILVPYSAWTIVARFIPSNAQITSQGGWRFIEEGVFIDIWPGDLGELAAHGAFVAAWNPKSGTRIVKG